MSKNCNRIFSRLSRIKKVGSDHQIFLVENLTRFYVSDSSQIWEGICHFGWDFKEEKKKGVSRNNEQGNIQLN